VNQSDQTKGAKMISPSRLEFYPLFANQNAEMLMKISMLAEEKEVDAGYQLFLEGDAANFLFLVMKGSVVLTMDMGEKVETLDHLGIGEVVGWSSIVKPNIYKFGAYTDQKSRLIIFKGDKLQMLFDDNPIFGYYFMKNLAEVIGDRLVSKCLQITSLVK
jgi:CRP-like cAMP-binding protein